MSSGFIGHTAIATALVALCAAMPAQPARANSPSAIDAVVRIQGSNAASGGTGTLIASEVSGGEVRLVFLVADHTIQRIGPLSNVGFGDLSAPKLDIAAATAKDVTVYEKGPDGTEDLALIGMTVSLAGLSASQQAYLLGVAPLNVAVAPLPFAPFTIAATGFGKSAAVLTYGTQQQFANVVNTYFDLVAGSYTTDLNNNPLVYTQSMMGWTYNSPNTGDWVPGEGAGYGGYSGSPVTLSGTSTVVGLQSSGSDTVNGRNSIALRLMPAYVDWIAVTSSGYASPVPEPATFALLLGGLAFIGRRAGRDLRRGALAPHAATS